MGGRVAVCTGAQVAASLAARVASLAALPAAVAIPSETHV
jgi:hypothetical protein